MKQNVTLLHAIVRISIGYTLLSFLTAKLAKNKFSVLCTLFYLLVGGYSVATGILRYCPFSKYMNQMKDSNEIEQKY